MVIFEKIRNPGHITEVLGKNKAPSFQKIGHGITFLDAVSLTDFDGSACDALAQNEIEGMPGPNFKEFEL